jgi:hypothetical protein
MNRILFAYTILFSAIILPHSLLAQESGLTQKLDSDNKIWVVVLVLATIFAGIIAFLIYLDRRIATLERDVARETSDVNRET